METAFQDVLIQLVPVHVSLPAETAVRTTAVVPAVLVSATHHALQAVTRTAKAESPSLQSVNQAAVRTAKADADQDATIPVEAAAMEDAQVIVIAIVLADAAQPVSVHVRLIVYPPARTHVQAVAAIQTESALFLK